MRITPVITIALRINYSFMIFFLSSLMPPSEKNINNYKQLFFIWPETSRSAADSDNLGGVVTSQS